MNKLRLIYIALVITVLILIAFAGFSGIYQAITRPNESATFTTQALIKVENLSVFHLVITNREGRDVNYTICTTVDDSKSCFLQPIGNESTFTYKRHIHPTENKEKKVTIVILKENETIENATYYV